MFAQSEVCQDDMIYWGDTWSKQTSPHLSHTTVFLCISSPLPPVASFSSHMHRTSACSSVAKEIKQLISLIIIHLPSNWLSTFVITSWATQPHMTFKRVVKTYLNTLVVVVLSMCFLSDVTSSKVKENRYFSTNPPTHNFKLMQRS